MNVVIVFNIMVNIVVTLIRDILSRDFFTDELDHISSNMKKMYSWWYHLYLEISMAPPLGL